MLQIGGYCILYATTVVNGDRFRWQPAAQSNCDFVMGVGITCILFAACEYNHIQLQSISGGGQKAPRSPSLKTTEKADSPDVSPQTQPSPPQITF